MPRQRPSHHRRDAPRDARKSESLVPESGSQRPAPGNPCAGMTTKFVSQDEASVQPRLIAAYVLSMVDIRGTRACRRAVHFGWSFRARRSSDWGLSRRPSTSRLDWRRGSGRFGQATSPSTPWSTAARSGARSPGSATRRQLGHHPALVSPGPDPSHGARSRLLMRIWLPWAQSAVAEPSGYITAATPLYCVYGSPWVDPPPDSGTGGAHAPSLVLR